MVSSWSVLGQARALCGRNDMGKHNSCAGRRLRVPAVPGTALVLGQARALCGRNVMGKHNSCAGRRLRVPAVPGTALFIRNAHALRIKPSSLPNDNMRPREDDARWRKDIVVRRARRLSGSVDEKPHDWLELPNGQFCRPPRAPSEPLDHEAVRKNPSKKRDNAPGWHGVCALIQQLSAESGRLGEFFFGFFLMPRLDAVYLGVAVSVGRAAPTVLPVLLRGLCPRRGGDRHFCQSLRRLAGRL